jgi:hypothetical protein
MKETYCKLEMLALVRAYSCLHELTDDDECYLIEMMQILPYNDDHISIENAWKYFDYIETDHELHQDGCGFVLLEEDKPYLDCNFEHCDCNAPELIDSFFKFISDELKECHIADLCATANTRTRFTVRELILHARTMYNADTLNKDEARLICNFLVGAHSKRFLDELRKEFNLKVSE